MENMINKLESAIKEGYNTKYAEWLNMSHEELIEKSDEIFAARFVKDNILGHSQRMKRNTCCSSSLLWRYLSTE